MQQGQSFQGTHFSFGSISLFLIVRANVMCAARTAPRGLKHR